MTPWPLNTEEQADVHRVHDHRSQRACIVVAERGEREENPQTTDNGNEGHDQSQCKGHAW